MKISVIIPSRAHVNPNSPREELWLDRALESVWSQTVSQRVEFEIVVGLDPGVTLPERLAWVRAVNARKALQAAALNAAIAASSGEFLAILEDDDVWEPRLLEIGLDWIDRNDMVTSNSREVTGAGDFVRFNDFPIPSGWLLRRATWGRIGPFDEGLVFHIDNDYLGRMTAAGARRLHLVEADAPARPWLENVARFSAIERTNEPDPLMTRTVNPDGGMEQIKRLRWASQQSWYEHFILKMRYGVVPW